MSREARQPDRRQIYARRGVIAMLALMGLVILTAYFRETQDGPLHDVQTDAGALVAPIQSGASQAVEPLREGWSWTTGLVTAREDARQLSAENAELRQQVVEARASAESLERQMGIASTLDGAPEGYEAVSARVTGRSVSNWYSRARLGLGRDDGVVVNSPVIAPDSDGSGALVGHVITVSSRSSVVTFITDPRTRVGGRVLDSSGAVGMIGATASGSLLLSGVGRSFDVDESDIVVTGGFTSGEFPSVYPPDLPIGAVVGVGKPEGDSYPPIQVRPFADPRVPGSMVVLIPVSEQAKRRAAG
jgi:rod shape-determining protein MreC